MDNFFIDARSQRVYIHDLICFHPSRSNSNQLRYGQIIEMQKGTNTITITIRTETNHHYVAKWLLKDNQTNYVIKLL
jgi:hypothetical protein